MRAFPAQCVPLIVCVLDWAFLGRQLPSLRSIFALLVVAGGCAGYVMTDRAFKLNGWGAYTWVSAYFVIISFEMAYGKHIVGPHLQFASSAPAAPAIRAHHPPAHACCARPAHAEHTPPHPNPSPLSVSLSRAQCGVLRCTQTQYRCHRWG